VLPKVAVLSLGGTIASSTDTGRGATVGLTGADLLESVPLASAVAALDVHTVAMVPSGDLQLHHLLDLREHVERAVAGGAAGVVVTQGTDTMEETAYALDLLTDFDQPVVFTGAMRHSSALSADGPANLVTAVRVAVEPDARSLGVLVTLNDEIHSARHVRKVHTSSTAAFTSPQSGPIGYVVEDRVRVVTHPGGRVWIDYPGDAADKRVAIITIGFDDDTALIDVIADLGYDGLVLAAFGGGHVPSWTVAAIERVAHRIPTVLASRALGGEVLQHTYGFAGSETDLLARGVICAGAVAASKARVLLRLLLGAGIKQDHLAGCFTSATEAPPGIVRRYPG
jgi:L-asparaginase